MARRRSLRPEEEELWQAVARTARPLHPKTQGFLHRHDKVAHPHPPVGAAEPAQTPQPWLETFRLGQKARVSKPHDIAPSLGESLRTAPLAMDAKVHGRMVRGKLQPEARMDLQSVVDGFMTMARLPASANVLFMTVMATKMPFVGRG